MRCLILAVLAVLILPGCGAQTTGKHLVVNNTFDIQNCGDVTISPDLATRSGDQALTTENPTAIDTNLDFMIDWLEAAGLTKAANKLKSVITEEPVVETEEPIVEEEVEEEVTEEEATEITYETVYDHTTAGGPDGGTSLILNRGQSMNFDRCEAGDVNLPRHDDDGREGYWNMTDVSQEDIKCTKGNTVYWYKGGEKFAKGKSN